MEKERDNFLEKLKKLVDLAKTKQNALDITEINDFLRRQPVTGTDGADL